MTPWLLLLVMMRASEAVVTIAPSTCAPALLETIRAEFAAAGFATGASDTHLATVIMRCDDQASVLARVEDKVTQKAVERSFEPSTDPRGNTRVAVLVVELLHASLAEARFASLVKVPEPVERFLSEREAPIWRGELAAGAMMAPGRFGVQPALSATLWRVHALRDWKLEVGALVEATIHATRLPSSAGSADLGLLAPRLVVAAAFEVGGVLVAPRLGLGALLVWASGNADVRHTASAGIAPTFAASLGVAASCQLNGWLAVGLGADASVTPFPVTVAMPDSTTRIGAPFFSISLYAAFR